MYLRLQRLQQFSIGPDNFDGMGQPGQNANKDVGGDDGADVVLTYAQGEGGITQFANIVTLNKVLVQAVERGTMLVGQETLPTLTVLISFRYQGEDRQLSVPLQAYVYDSQKDKEIQVSEVTVKPGDQVNLGLMYIPKDKEVNQEGIQKFCERVKDKTCLQYLGQGFGKDRLEVDEYLSGLDLSSKSKLLDIKQLVPVVIRVLGG